MLNKNPQWITIQNVLRFILLVFFLNQVPCYLSAQSNQSVAIKWKLSTTVDGVQFYYAVDKCGDKNNVYLKLNNQNNYKVEVTWKELFTTQADQPSEGFSGQKRMVVAPGVIEANSCNESKNRSLLILPEDVSPAYEVQIKSFAFKNISVSSL